MNCLLIFSILDGGPRKVNDLLTSPSNQFRDYSIWNRIEKLVPQHWNFAPQTLKTFKRNRPIRFQTRFFCEIWVSKNPGFVPGSPRGVYISRNDPKTKYFPVILANHQKTSFLIKWLPFLCLFLGPMLFFGPQMCQDEFNNNGGAER